MKRKPWGLIAAAAVVAADQTVKRAAQTLLSSPVTLVPGVVGLRYAENTGVAFSLLSGFPALTGLLSAGLILLGGAALRRYALGPLARSGAALMLGGAVGNMIDRLLRGYVIDMIELLFIRFPIFNVADAALTVGCALMAASLLFRPGEWHERERKSTNEQGNPL